MECILCWLFLILGVCNENELLCVVSALFAIAENCKRKN